MLLPRSCCSRRLQGAVMIHVTRMVLVPGICWALSCGPHCSTRVSPWSSRSFSASGLGVQRTIRQMTGSTDIVKENQQVESVSDKSGRFLIHWKGEDVEGYSIQFRHLEFCGALSAVLQSPPSDEGPLPVQFTNALNYSGGEVMPDLKVSSFNEAMQYVEMPALSKRDLIHAAKRCSLIHAVYQIVAEGNGYSELERTATENGGFRDMMVGGANEKDTWCVRVRRYGEITGDPKEKRYSSRARSMKLERKALKALKPLLLQFGGRVHLENPDCKIYIFDGLEGEKKVLARRITIGPRVSVIAPNTRICVTNTPLCPIAAFAMCNVAGLRNGHAVLDPFAGSCATLLAAAMIAPTSKTVGIEIAHNGLVNRDDIRKDFSTRGLTCPVDLILGDSSSEKARDAARQAIGEQPFDVIVTDPPYGIRESKSSNAGSPLVALFHGMAQDRKQGKPLLRKGGKLVTFVPCQHEEEDLLDCMPSNEQTQEAGLRMDEMREQPLNDKLSRWLIVYSCIT